MTTVRHVFDWYRANNVRSYQQSAQKERERIWRRFAESYGDLVVDDCRPFQLLEFINRQEGLRSDWTRKRWTTTIQRPFNVAAKLGMISRNPFWGVTMPQGDDGRDWTSSEYQAALRNSPPYMRRLLVFLRASGARPGEPRTCEWSHVDFEQRAIIQHRHKTRWATKAPRKIHFNHVIVKLLVWLKRHQPPGSRFVFLNWYGMPWTNGGLTKRFRAVRRKAGLSPAVKLHGGRHTFATHALINGVDLYTLKELLGHRNISSTQRYVHLVGKSEVLQCAMEKCISNVR